WSPRTKRPTAPVSRMATAAPSLQPPTAAATTTTSDDHGRSQTAPPRTEPPTTIAARATVRSREAAVAPRRSPAQPNAVAPASATISQKAAPGSGFQRVVASSSVPPASAPTPATPQRAASIAKSLARISCDTSGCERMTAIGHLAWVRSRGAMLAAVPVAPGYTAGRWPRARMAAGWAGDAGRGGARRRSLDGEQLLRTRLPAEDALGLGEVVLLLVLVAGDEEGVEAPVTPLHELERGQVGVRQVFFVGHEQRPHARPGRRRVPPLLQVLLARARTGDAQRHQVHVPPPREVLADQLAEPLRQAVDGRRVERGRLLLVVVLAAPPVHRHRGGVHAAQHALLLRQEERQVQPLAVDLVVLHDRLDVLVAERPALGLAHHQPDERVDPGERLAQRVRVGHRAFHELDALMPRRAKVEHAQRVLLPQIGCDERADVARAAEQQYPHSCPPTPSRRPSRRRAAAAYAPRPAHGRSGPASRRRSRRRGRAPPARAGTRPGAGVRRGTPRPTARRPSSTPERRSSGWRRRGGPRRRSAPVRGSCASR